MNYYDSIAALYNTETLYLACKTDPADGSYGGVVQEWDTKSTLENCNIQPYDGSRSLVDYGIETKAVARMFHAPDAAIVENAGVWLGDRTGEPDYEIAYVARWTKHYECLLEKR